MAHHHIPEPELEWRRHRRPASIMRPSTFHEIERRARARGYRNPKAVAGAVYWRVAGSKFRRRRRAHHFHHR